MKEKEGKKRFLIIMLIAFFSISFLFSETKAKIEVKEKEVSIPICSSIGEIGCPKGFKANCPKQYKPSCVFVGTKQLPACLADSADTTSFSYRLDKITCEKK